MLEKVHRPQLTRVVQSKEFGYLESGCSEKKGSVGGIKESTMSCLIWAHEDKYIANIQNSFQRQCSVQCVQLCFQNSGTNSFEGGIM